MKQRNVNKLAAGLAAVMMLTIFTTVPLMAAPTKQTELSADVIEYNAKTNIVTARGAVRLSQDDTVMTADAGEYNTRTNEGLATGKVKIVKGENTLTADQVRAFNMTRFLADGNVVLVNKSGTAKGPSMEYLSDRQYAIVRGGATLTNADGVLTASVVETFFNEDRSTASGNVHIISDVRKLDAVSDKAVYTGMNSKNGKVELMGNVRAVQEGNVLTGNHVTIFLDESAMDSDGRSKLVITPAKETLKDKK